MVKFVALFSAAFVALAFEIPLITAAPLISNGTWVAGDHNGRATYFFQDGAAGACGTVHADSDFIIALGPEEYGNGKNCGKAISITDKNSGVTTQGIVADLCPGCGAKNNIDLSVALFTSFEDEAVGVFPVVWRFVD